MNLNNPDERENLPSASGYFRLVQCPGSRNAEMAIPKSDKNNEVAETGTRIHDALLAGELEGLADSEERIAAKIKAMEEEAVLQWSKDIGREAMNVLREVRVWVKDAAGNKITSCRVDVAFVSGKHCLLLDAKTGFLPVTSADRNWQLRVGIVALDQEYGPFESARVAIAQYRLKEHFTRSDYAREHLDHAYDEIIFHDLRSKQPDAPFAAGPWCQYCRAADTCPTKATYSLLPSVVAQTAVMKKKDILAKVETLALPDLAFIESRRTASTNLFEAVKERLKTYSDEDLATVGLCKVPGRKTASVTDITKLWDILSAAGIVTEKEFQSFCDISIGRVKELLVIRLKLKHQCKTEDAEKKMAELMLPVMLFERGEPMLKRLGTGVTGWDPFTRAKRGFRLTARRLALREALARIAPAAFLETPSRRLMPAAADRKPG